MREIAAEEGAELVIICAQLEAELVALSPESAATISSRSASKAAAGHLIKSAYRLLGLMSFLTAGEKRCAPGPYAGHARPAGRGHIHTDIERGFIRAESSATKTSCAPAPNAAAREQGLTRLEGKEYVMREGDVVNFRFNV